MASNIGPSLITNSTTRLISRTSCWSVGITTRTRKTVTLEWLEFYLERLNKTKTRYKVLKLSYTYFTNEIYIFLTKYWPVHLFNWSTLYFSCSPGISPGGCAFNGSLLGGGGAKNHFNLLIWTHNYQIFQINRQISSTFKGTIYSWKFCLYV